jgi:hypothetical protein
LENTIKSRKNRLLRKGRMKNISEKNHQKMHPSKHAQADIVANPAPFVDRIFIIKIKKI